MHHFDDPKEMTMEERLKEVSAILATGYLRLKKRTPYLPELTSDAPLKNNVQTDKETSAVYQETS